MKRLRFYKPTRLRFKWTLQPYQSYAYTETFRVAADYNMNHAPMLGRMPRFLQWYPLTLVETTCKVCGKIFWTGWVNHRDVCNKWSCFQQYAIKNSHEDAHVNGKNTEEERRCI